MVTTEEKIDVIYRTIDKATKTNKQIDKSFKLLGKTLSFAKVGLLAVGVAAVASVKKFADFETAMVDVGNLTLASREEVNKMSADMIKLSNTLPQSSIELAKSLFDVVSAGIPAAKSVEFLRTASELATAGVTDTKTAVDGLTSVINAYQLSADDATSISDKFFTAQQRGKTTIAELSGVVGQLAPTFNAAGLSVDELFGGISALTLQGVRTNETVSQLRGIVTSIIKPTEEAAKAAKALGLEFSAKALKEKTLVGFLKEVNEVTGGNVDITAKLFGNVRALNGVLALANDNFESMSKISGDVATQTGVTSKAMAEQANTIGFKFKALMSQFGNTLITIGSMLSPFVSSILDSISGLITSVSDKFQFFDAITNLNLFILKSKLIFIDFKAGIKITIEGIKELIAAPFSFDTYKTIVLELFNRIVTVFNAIKDIAKKGLTGIREFQAQLAEDEKKEAQTLAEEIVTIKADANAQKLELLKQFKERELEIELEAETAKQSLLTEKLTEEEEKRTAIEKAEQQKRRALASALATQKIADAGKVEKARKSALKNDLANFQGFIKNISDLDREEIERKIADLDKLKEKHKDNAEAIKKIEAESSKFREELGRRDKRAGEEFLNFFVDAAQNRVFILEDLGRAMGKMIQKQLTQRVIAESAMEIGSLIMKAPGTFGFSLLGIPVVAAQAAATVAAINAVKFQDGGIVQPTPGGTPMNIGGTPGIVGEAAQAEAVIPLDKLADLFPKELMLVDSESNQLAKVIWNQQKVLQRTGEIT